MFYFNSLIELLEFNKIKYEMVSNIDKYNENLKEYENIVNVENEEIKCISNDIIEDKNCLLEYKKIIEETNIYIQKYKVDND